MQFNQQQHSKAGGRMPQASPPALRVRSTVAREVIRAETYQPDERARSACAHVDWLAFTVRPPGGAGPARWIQRCLREAFGISEEAWIPKAGGWNGYLRRADLVSASGQPIGLSAFGGESQLGSIYVSLNAHGCIAIADWLSVGQWGESSGAGIKRLDLAHDDFAAERITVDRAVQLWREGALSSNGRPPTAKLIDDFGSGDGRTFYVGRRQNGKLLRVYEKGRQLGDRASRWVRVEVELHSMDRVIPWDAVARPGCYFAGAYPAFRDFVDDPEQIKTQRRAALIEYAALQEWVRTAAGPALNAMLRVERGDAGAVLGKVVREAVPKRLIGYPRSVVDELGSDQP